MTRNGATSNSDNPETPEQRLAGSYYGLLGLAPSASAQQIRRAYREMSKLYHPDTTTLPAAVAIAKFQALNEAYATLSSPERRFAYDLKIGYSRVSVIQSPTDLNRPSSRSKSFRSSAYLDPTDRPLSPGEMFALFILGITFVCCLILVVAIGLTRGEIAFRPFNQSQIQQEISQPVHLPEQTINLLQDRPLETPPLESSSVDDELPQVQPNAESNALNSDFKDSVEELFISIPISSNQLPSADLASTSNQVEPNIFTTAHA
ncbi:MAG: J domain-containing protein [Leptolyngbyaceae cyanobacterium SM1_4_3]|nr:J domain-containing protein [Leptolyngbyaceae cyanobacterium SM1_4_3]NJN90281.1 J domain-containing protein [Leptolyngbyaceae cyanobacterium SL_5_14]NJO66849.1 J domain-containing protein [Leptolyngbyaceae cyanobacterium RM1_405_57]